MSKRPHITETTRKNLIDAFWKLYQTKDIEHISVKEITDIAGYNRGTFYLYFKDIYDVLENVESDVLNTMNTEIEKYRAIFKNSETKPDVAEITLAAIHVFEACDYKPLILMDDRRDSGFEKKLVETIRNDLLQRIVFDNTVDDCTKECIVHFFISGIIGVLKKWYDEGMVIPVEQHLAAVCNTLYSDKGASGVKVL